MSSKCGLSNRDIAAGFTICVFIFMLVSFILTLMAAIYTGRGCARRGCCDNGCCEQYNSQSKKFALYYQQSNRRGQM